MKKILIPLVCIMLLLTGCKQTSDKSVTGSGSSQDSDLKVSKQLNILYSSKDSLNPYTSTSEQNKALSPLLYDSLVDLDNTCKVEYRLAKTVTVNKSSCSVTLKEARFSDGSAVTASDIVFSFQKAKDSKTQYSAALKYVKSATSVSSDTVNFSLSRNDPYFSNLLTFPIIKSGSDSLKDADNRALPPIGAGPFVFDFEKNVLVHNTHFYGSETAIETIQLIDAPDSDAVDQAVKAGTVDFYFTDLLDNVIPKMNGTSANVFQNRMVFLGINSKNSILSDSYFRQAISAALNRESICTDAYYGKASAATGPYPSFWEPAKDFQTIEQKQNLKTSKTNIGHAGFSKTNKDGFYLLKNNKPVTLSLLVNKENECRVSAAGMIANQLKEAGIKINLKSVEKNDYDSMLKSGSYDLYIGEVRIEDNMDLGSLVNIDSAKFLIKGGISENSSASSASKSSSSIQSKPQQQSSSNSSGSSDTSNISSQAEPPVITLTSQDAYKGLYNGTYTVKDMIEAFTAELPVIPVCYRYGLAIYSNDFAGGLTPSRTNLFHGIDLLK